MATTRLLSAMVATWNNVATTFTGLKLNVTDTASAVGSLLMDLQTGGTSQFSVSKGGVTTVPGGYAAGNKALLDTGIPGLSLASDGMVAWSSTANYFNTKDVVLARDAANVLALRNGTAAQGFNVYNTYTDASNYERGVFDWAGTANTLRIGTEAAGTGTVRNIQLVAGSNTVTMTPGAANLLTLNGGLTTGAQITSGGSVVATAASGFQLGSGGSSGNLTAPSAAVWKLSNAAGTDFTRLILGTNDTSGIAIVKNAQAFDFKTGDAASFVDIQSRHLFVTNVFASGYVKSQSTTVAGLTAAATAGAGARSFVTDATATTFLSTVAGGGANKVPVVSDGTNWLIG